MIAAGWWQGREVEWKSTKIAVVGNRKPNRGPLNSCRAGGTAQACGDLSRDCCPPTAQVDVQLRQRAALRTVRPLEWASETQKCREARVSAQWWLRNTNVGTSRNNGGEQIHEQGILSTIQWPSVLLSLYYLNYLQCYLLSEFYVWRKCGFSKWFSLDPNPYLSAWELLGEIGDSGQKV